MPLIFCYCQYLSTAEFVMREELSLKIAILAEKFAPDLSWYEIDMDILKLHFSWMQYLVVFWSLKTLHIYSCSKKEKHFAHICWLCWIKDISVFSEVPSPAFEVIEIPKCCLLEVLSGLIFLQPFQGIYFVHRYQRGHHEKSTIHWNVALFVHISNSKSSGFSS